MDVDRKGGGEELKIKGQADAERRRAKPNSDEVCLSMVVYKNLSDAEHQMRNRTRNSGRLKLI